MTMKTILLEKNESGKPAIWKATIDGTTVTYEWGYKDGKKQTKVVKYTKGKNEGRANATTPEEQAVFEAEVKARKKLDKDYKIISGKLETTSETAQETHYDIPQPMLCNTYDKYKKRVDACTEIYVQPKLDGNRALCNVRTGKLYSRSRKEIAHLSFIGEEVKGACAKLRGDIEWVDGELFAEGKTFNEMQTIIRSNKNVDTALAKTMQYHIFDVLNKENWSYRRNHLRSIKPNKAVKVVKDEVISPNQVDEYHKKYVEEGYEGAIIRLGAGHYTHKRSMDILKVKSFKDEEFKVVGWTSEKHDEGKLGAAVCEVIVNGDAKTFEARPAMTDKEKAKIWVEKNNYLGKLATVKYQEKSPDGIPRFPVLKGFRSKEDM